MKIMEIYEEVIAKLNRTAPVIGSTFPHVESDGKWKQEDDITWWTNGFWPGIMWQVYDITKNDTFKIIAQECENKLDCAFDKFEGLHHDVGFMWGDSAVANFTITGNKKSRLRALHAATLLAGRYNIKWGGFISWEGNEIGRTIIDSMMNIRLLFWAFEQTGDYRFRHIAVSHADCILKNLIRSDGTSHHICEFSTETGELLGYCGGQGYDADSQWSRGQAWAIYGFTRAYEYTHDERYLKEAQICADNFIEKCGMKTPEWDFCAVEDYEFVPDTSAGACAASGIITLAQYSENKEKYIKAAESILIDMYENYRSNGEMILTGGTGSRTINKNVNKGLIYGDFYFIEALRKLCDKDYRNIFA